MFGAVDWPVLFGFDRALLEIFVRGTVMSLSLLILLRVTPSHETGDASPTGLLVIVLLADAAQNAMAGQYRSIADGLVLVGTAAHAPRAPSDGVAAGAADPRRQGGVEQSPPGAHVSR